MCTWTSSKFSRFTINKIAKTNKSGQGKSTETVVENTVVHSNDSSVDPDFASVRIIAIEKNLCHSTV